MATYLYRLGRWSYDRRRRVITAWRLVLALVVGCAAAFKGQTNNKFEVPGTESQQAQELLNQRFPEGSGAFARVVYAAPEGQLGSLIAAGLPLITAIVGVGIGITGLTALQA